MNPVLLYKPNLLNYLRFLLLLVLLFNIRKRPLFSFILVTISGLLDVFDGDLARELDESSKLGYMLDKGMDRLTSSAHLFVLAIMFPKYWLMFFSVQFVEIINDISEQILKNYHLFIDIAEMINQQNQNLTTIIKNTAYEQTGLYKFGAKIAKDTCDSECFRLRMFYYYTWYSSDFFYWIIYIAGFIKMGNIEAKLYDLIDTRHKEVSDSPGSTRGKTTIFRLILSPISEFFTFLLNLFDNLTFIIEKILSDYKLGICVKNLINLKILFRSLGIFLFIGAFLKFYLNISYFYTTLINIANIDNQVRILKKSIYV